MRSAGRHQACVASILQGRAHNGMPAVKGAAKSKNGSVPLLERLELGLRGIRRAGIRPVLRPVSRPTARIPRGGHRRVRWRAARVRYDAVGRGV